MFLFVSDCKKAALKTIRSLSEHGFFVLLSPFETARFLCDKKDTGGVIVDCSVNEAKGLAVCAALRHSYADLPMAVLAVSNRSPAVDADLILSGQIPTEVLCSRLENFLSQCCSSPPERLSTPYFSVEPQEVRGQYMGYTLHLTPSECRMLYCLLYRAPDSISADELCAFSRLDRATSPTAIRACIRRINRSAEQIAPQAPPLIGYRRGRGFFLSV